MLHSVYCAVILALIETSMNYVPETLIFRCSNLFQMAKSTLLTGYVGRSRMQMNSCYISTTLLGSICGTFKATYWSPVFLDGNQVMLMIHTICVVIQCLPQNSWQECSSQRIDLLLLTGAGAVFREPAPLKSLMVDRLDSAGDLCYINRKMWMFITFFLELHFLHL